MLIYCQYIDFFYYWDLCSYHWCYTVVVRWVAFYCFTAAVWDLFPISESSKWFHRVTTFLKVDRVPILFIWCSADIHRWMNRIRICCCHLNFLCLRLLKQFCCYTDVIMCQYRNWFSSLDWHFPMSHAYTWLIADTWFLFHGWLLK